LELLINTAEARDILDICFLTALYNIDFSFISLKDVYKLVLKAGNIVFKAEEISIAIL
jgi:hypothetical protein